MYGQSLKRNCKGEYTYVDSTNELCLRDLNYYDEASKNHPSSVFCVLFYFIFVY